MVCICGAPKCPDIGKLDVQKKFHQINENKVTAENVRSIKFREDNCNKDLKISFRTLKNGLYNGGKLTKKLYCPLCKTQIKWVFKGRSNPQIRKIGSHLLRSKHSNMKDEVYQLAKKYLNQADFDKFLKS